MLNTITKFTKGKETLDQLLCNQTPSLNKHGIGFSQNLDIPYENGFVRASTNEKYIFVVKLQKSNKWMPRDKRIWTPKANKIGPKMIGVPKSLLSSCAIGVA